MPNHEVRPEAFVVEVMVGAVTKLLAVPVITVPLVPTIISEPDSVPEVATEMPRRFWVVPEAFCVHVTPSGLVRMIPPSPTAMKPLPVYATAFRLVVMPEV